MKFTRPQSPLPPDPHIGCLGKVRYTSPAAATNVGQRMQKRKRRESLRDNRKLAAYKCAHCGGWHLGHST